MLFTAGNSLTTGGFLYYFIYEFEAFKASPFLLAAVQVAPETCEALSVMTRRVLNIVRSRKWLWISSLLIARAAALLIPLALVFNENSSFAVKLILWAVVFWHLFQGIAYCSYISWLSELIPEMNWGSFFAKRKIASLLISIVVPISAGLIRKSWLNELSDVWKSRSYVVIFITGALLVTASVIPMLWIPDRKVTNEERRRNSDAGLKAILQGEFSWLLASCWWLSFFQGLTQAVIFKFSVSVLKIQLEEYYILLAIMLSIQMLTSWWAGKICDRNLERKLLMWSLVGVSFAMFFWMFATPDSKWIATGAYVLWGGFGFVNIALQNLTLKLAPKRDNTLHISLTRLGSGLVAGLAGLLGGFWLQELLEGNFEGPLTAFQFLFLVSWMGRMTAACWLIPIRQRSESDSENVSVVL